MEKLPKIKPTRNIFVLSGSLWVIVLLFMHVRVCFFLWEVCLNMIIHTLKWKKLIWPTTGGQTSGCSLVLAWGQFGPIEIEIFLPSIFGAKSTYCRRTVFFKKFLISTKNYRQSLGASYRRIFSRNNFFLSQLLVRFQANKMTHTHWLLWIWWFWKDKQSQICIDVIRAQ